jgi:hypothetical protein
MNKKTIATTQKTLSLLHAGKLKGAERYAGKHVYVAGGKVIPIQKGVKAQDQLKEITKKYGRSAVLTFVPLPGMSYTL